MDPIAKKLIVGAVSGVIGAVLVDLDAWQSSEDGGFNWKKALRRWIYGAVAGAASGVGLGSLVP